MDEKEATNLLKDSDENTPLKNHCGSISMGGLIKSKNPLTPLECYYVTQLTEGLEKRDMEAASTHNKIADLDKDNEGENTQAKLHIPLKLLKKKIKVKN